MNKKIKTTGELRDFLSTLMLDVKNGTLELDKANRITKLAGQINENFYAEIKVSKVLLEAGAAVNKFGELPIGSIKS